MSFQSSERILCYSWTLESPLNLRSGGATELNLLTGAMTHVTYEQYNALCALANEGMLNYLAESQAAICSQGTVFAGGTKKHQIGHKVDRCKGFIIVFFSLTP